MVEHHSKSVDMNNTYQTHHIYLTLCIIKKNEKNNNLHLQHVFNDSY